MTSGSGDIDARRIWPLLPTEPQWLLLKVTAGGLAPPPCRASPDAVRHAWHEWCDRVIYPRRAILADRWGIKAMLPILAASLAQASVGMDRELQTILRAACLREQLRLATIRRLVDELLDVLADRSIDPLIAGELALAESAYRFDPALRHCGEIHLVVRQDELRAATDALLTVDWREDVPSTGAGPSELRLVHASGLPMVLGSELRLSPAAALRATSLQAGSVWGTIGGRRVRQLAPGNLLLSVLADGLRRGYWTAIQWVCDVWMLTGDGMDPDDWAVFVSAARNGRIARLAATAMKQIADHLEGDGAGAIVPTSVLDDLSNGPSDPAERQWATDWSEEAVVMRPWAALSAAPGPAQRRQALRITMAWQCHRLRERLRLWALKRPPIHRLARGVLRIVRLGRRKR